MNSGSAGFRLCGCLLIACLALAVVLGWLTIRIVPPGYVAVVSTFGHVDAPSLEAGVNFCNPFATTVLFSTKTSLLEQTNHVPTKEGVTVELDLALLYHVQADKANDIYRNIGENFVDVVMQPELASAVRGLTSEYDASALYTSGRAEMQEKLQTWLTTVLEAKGIAVESVLLKGVVLPQLLKDSIEQKAQAQQEAARMQYVLQKEKQEAERKKIEAGGIAEFQRVVSQGISSEMLMWKGIETTAEIAKSSNAKIVLIGNSKDSLPLILGDSMGQQPAYTQPAASPALPPTASP
eukprot:CAMPEP_0119327332 /NCGR_PEP_ID=MMETSP1333-20130426/70528_1 /TAXON_ID=418940 /ORGANISM="Scyphosphaera apsteinii, Strain RCC1455" /LENGTH=293 /DNA_ID=CAMNT_0007335899 /DNA_START=64 /DNA_END=945 /DNA_ORIENTATION=-